MNTVAQSDSRGPPEAVSAPATVKVPFVAAELVLRRAWAGEQFTGPERRVLERHLENSFRKGQMVAVYSSVEAICNQVRIDPKKYYAVLHGLLRDHVLEAKSKVAYALIPEPLMWAEERRPASADPALVKGAARWNKSASARYEPKQGEFFEWPVLSDGLRQSFLDAAMAEIYQSTGAGREIPGAELPSSGGSPRVAGLKGDNAEGLGSTSAEKPPTPGPAARSPAWPGDGQSEPAGQRPGCAYHPKGGITPRQPASDTTLKVVLGPGSGGNPPSDTTQKVVFEGDTTKKVVSAEAHKQRAESDHAEGSPVNKGQDDTTFLVVSPEAHKQRPEWADTTQKVVSEPRVRARNNDNVIVAIATNDQCAKRICSEETESRLMDEIVAFLTAPGHRALKAEEVPAWLRDSGKFWRCCVVRPCSGALEVALGEGKYFLHRGLKFKKSRGHWLNYQVRLELGITSWSQVRPIYQRET